MSFLKKNKSLKIIIIIIFCFALLLELTFSYQILSLLNEDKIQNSNQWRAQVFATGVRKNLRGV